jgi:hypothetical protein
MSSDLSSPYFCNIEQKYDTDAITLEELDHSHPRSVITINNGCNLDTKKDNELSYFNTRSIIDMVAHGKYFNPTTREIFDDNQLKRINWYKQCLEMFSDIKSEDIADYQRIISDWLLSPLEDNVNTHKARYFATYDQIIEYFGFKEINSREKAEEYFLENPTKTWVIRKSSVTDTKYNQFFVMMIKTVSSFNNYLYVHRQGYGVCRVDASRNADITTAILRRAEYYTNIVDLLLTFDKNGMIKL